MQRILHDNILKVTAMQVLMNQNKHNKNECGQYPVSVTHKVSDHDIHLEGHWLAAITPK
jgi:hypothetical protein